MNESDVHIFTTQHKVDWADIDAFNHVNNLAYFRYVQSARVSLCGSVGIETNATNPGVGFMVAKTECSFIKSVDYPDSIQIQTIVVKTGNSSFDLHHTLMNSDGDPVAKAKDVLVLFDFTQHSKVQISPEIRNRLNQYSAQR